ncbi:MAG TPA: ATP-binding protein [Nitrospira sp.]|nr:ATP-binding protein [Nitrospira sp.]
MAQSRLENLTELRRRPEADLSRVVMQSVPSLPPESVEALVHELRVHQIELEAQCQELMRAHAEVEESRNRYRELYESIPLGYVTVEADGRIQDLNPVGAALLGLTGKKHDLHNFFFYAQEADALILFCKNALLRQEPTCCELTMKRADDGVFMAALQAVPGSAGEKKGRRLRIAFKDITRRKVMEETFRQQQTELEANRIELQDLAGKLFSAQEEERRRIACDIHDDHCQRITALILETSSLSRLLLSTMPSLVPRMESMKTKLNDILEDFRHLAHDLHPRHLDTISLALSMRTHIKEVSEYSGLQIDFQEEEVPSRLPMAVTVCLYRLLQESLNNARKHAAAGRVQVRLSATETGLQLSVADDGNGLTPGRSAEGRKEIGLTSMQERLRPLGGQVRIASQPGQGTTVTVSVPLRRQH